MNKSRALLNAELLQIVPNVYFQPPENVKMKFPCIVYSRDRISLTSADDLNYKVDYRYRITLIDKNPDSIYIEPLIAKFAGLSYENHFIADGLHHDIFTLFY